MEENTTVAGDTWQVGVIGKAVISVILGSIVIIGIIGNVLVIVLIALAKKLHSVVSLCLSCLALVDLMVLVFLPIFDWFYLYDVNRSSLGPNLCVFILSLNRPAATCTALIFLLIAVERYTLVCHPLKTLGGWTWKKVLLGLFVIFMTSAGVAVPYGTATMYGELVINENTTRVYCALDWSISWLAHCESALFIVGIVLLILVLFLYAKVAIALKTKMAGKNTPGTAPRAATKSRSQMVAMLLVTVTVFVSCLLPRCIYVILEFYVTDAVYSLSNRSRFIIKWLLSTLFFINHASNPVIYFLMTDNFREAFKAVFCSPQRVNQGHDR